jgi:hypothetical protein
LSKARNHGRFAMILTPIHADSLTDVLSQFAATILDDWAAAVFRRIAVPAHAKRATGAVAAEHHRDALRLAAQFRMGILPGSPLSGFGWDGMALRATTEAYVLLHEVAHFQLASPARRRALDFGLGAGPESGERHVADAAAQVSGLDRDREEAMASLLGVLWEVELGHPALASFIDQNWLEGAGRRSAADHFETVLRRLREARFVDPEGRPTRWMRRTPDRVDF